MAAPLVGSPLRRIFLALSLAGKLRVREKDAFMAVALPAGCAQRGTFVVELDTGRWGVYRREVPVEETPLTDSGLYRLLRHLDIPMADIASAIDGQ